jgi:hypothetical protein
LFDRLDLRGVPRRDVPHGSVRSYPFPSFVWGYNLLILQRRRETPCHNTLSAS